MLAAIWYRKAADQGHTVAMRALGRLYLASDGLQRDDVEALTLFRKAAAQGDSSAQHALALMYCNGYGVPKDLEEAYAWLSVSLAQAYVKSTMQATLHFITNHLDPDALVRAQALSKQYMATFGGSHLH